MSEGEKTLGIAHPKRKWILSTIDKNTGGDNRPEMEYNILICKQQNSKHTEEKRGTEITHN